MKTNCILFLFISAALAARADYTNEIQFLAGERWYGAACNLGEEQPIDATTKTYNRRYNSPWHDLAIHNWGGAVMPLLVSDKGRYLWSERPFKFRAEAGSLFLVSAKEKIEPVTAGSTLKDAYLAAARHFPFSGIPPAEFFTKPQFNNWIEMYLRGVNQKVCEAYADEIHTNGFPCGVHMVDGGWMLYHGAVKFNPQDYPDPVRLFDKLHAYGWKSMLWFAYFVSPDSRDEYRRFRYHPHNGRGGYAKGLDILLHRKNSRQAAVVRWWSGISAAYDLTNPKVRNFFTDRILKFASDYHFDGFKFDAGDPISFVEDCRFHETWMQPCDYAQAWNEVGFRVPYNEYRSGFKTGGKPLVQRLHDQPHTWEAQSLIIRDLVTAGLIGYPYVVPDMIGGGLCGSYSLDSTVTPELVVRSCEVQTLMPMMQFSYAPWRLPKEMCDICRDMANLHCAFGPYIYGLAEQASKTGEPILRSMEYEFPNQGFADVFTQFMLGPKWLVAPVLTAENRVTVRLPTGRWRDDLGATHVGPKTLELADVPLARLPRFERMEK